MKFKNSNVRKLTEGVEDYIAQEAELQVDGKNPDAVLKALDESLSTSLRNKYKLGNGRPSNLFIWGDPGAGKTSKVLAWAEGYRNGKPQNYTGQKIHVVKMKGPEFDEVITRGAVAKNPEDEYTLIRLTTTEFDKLNRYPNTVLYVDEANRTKPSAIDALLKLVDEKVVADSREDDNERKLDNLLFTIFSANYEDSDRGQDTTAHKLSAAMLNRGGHIDTANSPKGWLSWYAHDLASDIEFAKKQNLEPEELQHLIDQQEAKFRLARTLVLGGLTFDTREVVAANTDDQKPSVNSRGISHLFDAIDGTKADLIKKWPRYCNDSNTEAIKNLLADYEDDPNLKSNQAIDYDSTSSLLNGKESIENTNAAAALNRYKKTKA